MKNKEYWGKIPFLGDILPILRGFLRKKGGPSIGK